ncbi:hypothetical protein J437_LFUL019647, partial [Ladona fulva]
MMILQWHPVKMTKPTGWKQKAKDSILKRTMGVAANYLVYLRPVLIDYPDRCVQGLQMILLKHQSFYQTFPFQAYHPPVVDLPAFFFLRHLAPAKQVMIQFNFQSLIVLCS